MKILLIGPIQSTFVKNDIKILSKSHTVEVLDSLKLDVVRVPYWEWQ
jgi:hypothetical protein